MTKRELMEMLQDIPDDKDVMFAAAGWLDGCDEYAPHSIEEIDCGSHFYYRVMLEYA